MDGQIHRNTDIPGKTRMSYPQSAEESRYKRLSQALTHSGRSDHHESETPTENASLTIG